MNINIGMVIQTNAIMDEKTDVKSSGKLEISKLVKTPLKIIIPSVMGIIITGMPKRGSPPINHDAFHLLPTRVVGFRVQTNQSSAI